MKTMHSVVTLKNVERVTFDNQTIAQSTTTSDRVAEFITWPWGAIRRRAGWILIRAPATRA